MVPDNTPTVGVTAPFRSHFPIRYYIDDFETAVCFNKDSDPATRKITGLPDIRVGRTKGNMLENMRRKCSLANHIAPSRRTCGI